MSRGISNSFYNNHPILAPIFGFLVGLGILLPFVIIGAQNDVVVMIVIGCVMGGLFIITNLFLLIKELMGR